MPRIGTLKDLASLDTQKAVVVSPSDTTYGIHSRSLPRVQELKNRQGNFIYLVGSLNMVNEVACVTPKIEKILERHWPGAITFVLPSKADSQKTVAVRFPKDPFCQSMIEAFQGPVLSTSCNLPKGKPVDTLEEAIDLFGDRVNLYIDGGRRSGFIPSTLVDLTVEPHRILRQGELNYRQEQNK